MQVTYSDNGHINVALSYDSIGDLVRVAEKRLATPDDALPNRHRTDAVTGPASFSNTRSLEHAADIMRTGWPEARDKMVNCLDSPLSVPALASLTPALEYDVSGEFPDVGAFCSGEPEHMVTLGEQKTAVQPVLHIVFIAFYHWRLDTRDVENYGIGLLSVLNAIHRSGRTFTLDALGVAMSNGTRWADSIPLITPGAAFDIARLSAALHPCFLRRMLFASWELNDRIARDLNDGYGQPKWTVPPELREPGKIYLPGPAALFDWHRPKSIPSPQWAAEKLTAALRAEAAALFTDTDK